MLCSLLTILLLTMDDMVNVKAAPFSLSPFFHIPLDHKGLTILVCVVNDVLNRDRGMAWFSQRASRSNSVSYHILGKEDAQSAVSFPSLVSSWDTYTCFISHRNMIQFKAGHNYGFPKSRKGFINDNIKCSHPEHQSFSAVIRAHTVFLVNQFLRIILVKITVFNVLMTAQAVIKW
ncbi:hypothetical protein HF521_014572 [Silurus meridionalis]|uniref:Immunoglobulin V-set domain-containing protein n=1 Tax=Silurus meridionalis TaxID=175797 RepID=A0A8T0A6Q1_SILME|nr:hypothetical protein HF521_014572 [Silurus meridionalis]